MLDLSWSCNKLTNLADVERIVVTLGLGLWVENVWVFPGLCTLVSEGTREFVKCSYLRERPIVPEVAFVRKAVADIAKLALLDILLDGVQCFFLGYLEGSYQHQCL